MDETLETGTHHFLDRMNLTARFEQTLDPFLGDHGFEVMPFGQSVLLGENTWIASRLKRIAMKKSLAALMVKFSPDFIVVKGDPSPLLFFCDVKASITPVFFGSQIQRIRLHSDQPGLQRSHIGEIEREAWFSYNTFYPSNEVAIVVASPYSTRPVLAEWVSNIRCLWCYSGEKRNGKPVPWDCSKCSVKTKKGFGVVVNEEAGGSGTPHTNIDFRSMRTLDEFLLQEFNVTVDRDLYEEAVVGFVKQWPLNKPRGSVTWKQFNNPIRELREEGCAWLEYRVEEKMFDDYDEFDAYLHEYWEEHRKSRK